MSIYSLYSGSSRGSAGQVNIAERGVKKSLEKGVVEKFLIF